MCVKLQTYVFDINYRKIFVSKNRRGLLPKYGPLVSEVPLGKNHLRYNDFIFTSKKLEFDSRLTIDSLEETEMELCKLV